MLRAAFDDEEALAAAVRLEEARVLMKSALAILDDTPVMTDCDAHLDQAIHSLTRAILDVRAGEHVFHDSPTPSRVPD
ncbi:MAG TPA: hypothetical protein VEZ48_09985 [Sphingomonadaceae bacterium]|nr:hypothetical protein [Sphingomonadaceae bacterium]